MDNICKRPYFVRVLKDRRYCCRTEANLFLRPRWFVQMAERKLTTLHGPLYLQYIFMIYYDYKPFDGHFLYHIVVFSLNIYFFNIKKFGYVFVGVCVCICYLCMSVCAYLCVYVCVYICVCVCVYMYECLLYFFV